MSHAKYTQHIINTVLYAGNGLRRGGISSDVWDRLKKNCVSKQREKKKKSRQTVIYTYLISLLLSLLLSLLFGITIFHHDV
jgi:uncharacterized protein YqhQ